MLLDLVVTSPAADRRLVLPSELVIEQGVTAVQAEDLADRASRQFACIAGRAPWRQTYVEQVRGSGRPLLLLSRWPIEGEPSTDAADRSEDPPAVTIIDNGAIALDLYHVTGSGRHALYRQGGWASPGYEGGAISSAVLRPSPLLHYSVTYTAGWLSPGLLGRIDTAATPDRHVQTWEAATAYVAGASHAYGAAVGGWVLPTAPNGCVFRCSTSGNSDATEPTWDTDIGATTADGTAVWTAHPDYILPPEAARQAARALARKILAFDRNQDCPADCADVENMIRRAFGGAY